MTNVLLIGAGNMGFAMLRTWVGGSGHRFSVVEMHEALRKRAEDVGADAYPDVSDLPAGYRADVIVVATKPQAVADALARSTDNLREGGLVISVAAGITIAAISRSIGDNARIIRAMPNTPAAVGEGMIVCCASHHATEADRDRASALLSVVGRVAFVEEEDLMDAVTAISGSGPAYVFYFLETFSAAAVSLGLSEELAMTLAKHTVFGASKMALERDTNPSDLRAQVTSPNGTTAAALSVLMDVRQGLAPLMHQATEAARRRSRELGLQSP
jgi:pyrroline-5-carboxylate reductase